MACCASLRPFRFAEGEMACSPNQIFSRVLDASAMDQTGTQHCSYAVEWCASSSLGFAPSVVIEPVQSMRRWATKLCGAVTRRKDVQERRTQNLHTMKPQPRSVCVCAA